MKIVVILVMLMFSGCGFSLFNLPESPSVNTPMMGAPVAKAPGIEVPVIELPPDIEKPQIKSEVLYVGGKYFVAYSASDGMKLLEYMIKQDGQIDKLKYRIKLQNELMQKWSK